MKCIILAPDQVEAGVARNWEILEDGPMEAQESLHSKHGAGPSATWFLLLHDWYVSTGRVVTITSHCVVSSRANSP